MNILEIIILLPILGSILIALGMNSRHIAVLSGSIVLLLSLIIAFIFNTNIEGSYQFNSSYKVLSIKGIPNVNMSFGIDGVSLILLLLSAIITFSAVIIPINKNIKIKNDKVYFISILLIASGAIGAFCSTDIIFMYIFHELALIPTFIMIGMFGKTKNKLKVAWTTTLYLAIASIILLIGIIMLISSLGSNSTSIESLIALSKNTENPLSKNLQSIIASFLIIGFGTLASLFPFHSWAAKAYSKSPTPVAILHSAVLKKFGIYGIIRIVLPTLPEGMEFLSSIILILLLGNIIYLGLITLYQSKLDLLISYSSIMHIGYAFLAIVAGNKISISGVVLFMFAHGISIALLFILSDFIYDKFNTNSIKKLSGLSSKIPKLGFIFGCVAFASIGLPGFANFAGELSIFFGAFSSFKTEIEFIHLITMISIWGLVISAVYMLRAYKHIFFGKWNKSVPFDDNTKFPIGTKFSVTLLLAVLIIVGITPEILNQFIRPTIESFPFK